MTQDHDNVCHHRAQLERDLQNTTQEKNILEKQLTQTQVCLILRSLLEVYTEHKGLIRFVWLNFIQWNQY